MAMKIDRARLFDKRVVQRNIRAGRVTKDEYQAWLADQSDVGDKVMARDEGGDDDGYEVPIRAASLSIAPFSAGALSVAAPFSGAASLSGAADDDDEDDDDEDDDDDDDEADEPVAEDPPTSDQAG